MGLCRWDELGHPPPQKLQRLAPPWPANCAFGRRGWVWGGGGRDRLRYPLLSILSRKEKHQLQQIFAYCLIVPHILPAAHPTPSRKEITIWWHGTNKLGSMCFSCRLHAVLSCIAAKHGVLTTRKAHRPQLTGTMTPYSDFLPGWYWAGPRAKYAERSNNMKNICWCWRFFFS